MLKSDKKKKRNVKKVDESIFAISKKEKTKYLLLSYLCIFSLCLLFYHSLILSLLLGFISFWGLERYETFLREKKKAMVLKEFKDFLYSMSTSFSITTSFYTALKNSENTLRIIYKKDSYILAQVELMLISLEKTNESEQNVLKRFAQNIPMEDVKNFVDVFSNGREVGADIEKVIRNCTEIIGDKIAIEREIRSIMAQKRFESKIIIGLPILTVLFLNIFSPEYLENLYGTFLGVVVMTIALVGILGAFLLMERITRIEI